MRRCLGLFLVSLVLTPTAATAHGGGVKTNPDHGEVLEQLPAEATVSFGQAPTKADVVLETPAGTVVKLKTQISDTTVTVVLPPTGPRGDYTLSYRVVSADGHPVDGSATFTVTTGPEPAATTPAPAETVRPSTADGTGGWSSLAMAGGAALIALAAGLLFWLMRR